MEQPTPRPRRPRLKATMRVVRRARLEALRSIEFALVVAGIATLSGCYAAHQRGLSDAGAGPDAAVSDAPASCGTHPASTCEPDRSLLGGDFDYGQHWWTGAGCIAVSVDPAFAHRVDDITRALAAWNTDGCNPFCSTVVVRFRDPADDDVDCALNLTRACRVPHCDRYVHFETETWFVLDDGEFVWAGLRTSETYDGILIQLAEAFAFDPRLENQLVVDGTPSALARAALCRRYGPDPHCE